MITAALCVVAFVIPLFAQTEGTYLIRYLNDTQGSGINMTNTGSSIGLQVNLTPTPGGPTTSRRGPFEPGTTPYSSDGFICANVYVFSPDEQLQACCSCPLSPNSLANLTAPQLVSNTLTGITAEVTSGFTVKLVASVAGVPTPSGFPVSTFHTCDVHTAATVGQVDAFGNPIGQPLATGLAAWAVTTHGAGAAVTETPFTVGQLSNLNQSPRVFASELGRLTGLCSAIVANGSGAGVCPVCTPGSL